jgi:hypothetical protein
MSLFGKVIDEFIGALSGRPPTQTPVQDALRRVVRTWPQPWMVVAAWVNGLILVAVGAWVRGQFTDEVAQLVGKALPIVGVVNAVGLTVVWWWRRDA